MFIIAHAAGLSSPSFAGVGLHLVGEAQKVVYAGVIVLAEFDEHFRRDVPVTELIMRIASLGTMQVVSKNLLLQIAVFA